MRSSQLVRRLGRRLSVRCSSTSRSSEGASLASIRRLIVTEFPASESSTSVDNEGGRKDHKRGTTYEPCGDGAWLRRERLRSTPSWRDLSVQDYLFQHVVSHFLPAQYPHSVQPGYSRYSGFCFAAAVAGSAGMVLSTQTLLLAVGVVGAQQVQTAGIMAGALNWVLKDGVGQLGGVWFASRMGHTKRFDSHPKKWRMTAAVALDGAALLEIMSPFMAAEAVLPLACTANVLKNIGFLTASASRAALHQSLALSNNLADVTVKAGSQSMAAGLMGTAFGVGLSTTVLSHDPLNFVAGLCCLSACHLTFNYTALRSVSLNHLNRPRLDLLMEEYLKTGLMMTPPQVAVKEEYMPLVKDKDTSEWLCIGCHLKTVAPNGVEELGNLLDACEGAKYVLSVDESTNKIHLVFLVSAGGNDLMQGVFHANQLRQMLASKDCSSLIAIHRSYIKIQESIGAFLQILQAEGWRTELTNIEPPGSVRLAINTN